MSEQQQQTATTDLELAADTARDSAIRALEERGITRPDQLVAASEPITVLAWCRWWDAQHGVSPALLVDRIRSGDQPPRIITGRTDELDRQARYLADVVGWLVRKMPEVCTADPKVVEATRRVYGEGEANGLALDNTPHPAAIAAVIRLHHTAGKLTVKTHGPDIRTAVRTFDARAITDLAAIASARQKLPPAANEGQEES
jgi:hypothetical protein